MKRFLVLMVALSAMVAFASMALAQTPPKTEKPAALPPGPAPEKAAPEKVEKPKVAKPKPPKPITGVVSAYEAGQMIAVKVKDKEMKFDIAPAAKIKGEVKPGAKVTVAYKKEGDKMVANSISVAPPPKKKEAPPKVAPMKEVPPKETPLKETPKK